MADRNYKKWRGNPWDRQSWRIKETPRKYEAFVLFYRGKSLGEIAQEMGWTLKTVQETYRRNQWEHRVRSFGQFQDPPEHVSPGITLHKSKLERQEQKITAEIESITADQVASKAQREVDIEKELQLLETISSQVQVLADQYDKVSALGDRYWKACDIGVNALLADKERLQSLSVTELKALQGIAIETGTYKAKLSQDSSGLGKLAEYVTAQLKSKKKRGRK